MSVDLPATGRPDHADEFAPMNVQRNAVEDDVGVAVGPVRFLQIADFHDRPLADALEPRGDFGRLLAIVRKFEFRE